MFHPMPAAMRERMRHLEAVDAREREAGLPRHQRLRQIPPETGRFLALMAACAPPEDYVEIGAGGGYSGLWIALACREKGARLTTYEILGSKVDRARETFQASGVEDVVDLVLGDAHARLRNHAGIAFCFLDAEKEDYQAFYELVVPRLVPGGLLVADNVLSHAQALGPLVAHAREDRRVDAVLVPIGKGLLVCRKPWNGAQEHAGPERRP